MGWYIRQNARSTYYNRIQQILSDSEHINFSHLASAFNIDFLKANKI